MKTRYFKKKWTNEWVKISEYNKMEVVIVNETKFIIGINIETFAIQEVLNTYDYCTKNEFEQKFNEAKNEIGL